MIGFPHNHVSQYFILHVYERYLYILSNIDDAWVYEVSIRARQPYSCHIAVIQLSYSCHIAVIEHKARYILLPCIPHHKTLLACAHPFCPIHLKHRCLKLTHAGPENTQCDSCETSFQKPLSPLSN